MKISKSNFSEWYNEVLEACEIVDIRYPVKGMPVYKPWGFKALRSCFRILETMLDKTGHRETMFPMLVPDDQFGKESDHIKGFGEEVLWVTHGGSQPLERKLAVRPTSETVMYPMFSLWVRTHADLPLRVHQTLCVYRHDTKATRPLIRGREIYWNEAHTVHANAEDCQRQVGIGVGIYADFYAKIGVPCMVLKRPKHDTFPGADYSIAFDALMPDGKILQAGTVHNLGQNFAKVYDVGYADEKGERKTAYQTCYGMSMRCLAAAIAIHGDDKGLVFPSAIAPVQAVIVPVFMGGEKEAVLVKARALKEMLADAGLRCDIDERDIRPGDKYYHWESLGVPLRIEIGPRDLAAKKVVLATRDGEKKSVDEAQVIEQARAALGAFDARIYEKAKKGLEANKHSAADLKKLHEIMEQHGGLVKIGWCESESCAKKIGTESGAELRGSEYNKMEEMKCIGCGKQGMAYWAANAY
jgi:prolyl-tRNA synthetase